MAVDRSTDRSSQRYSLRIENSGVVDLCLAPHPISPFQDDCSSFRVRSQGVAPGLESSGLSGRRFAAPSF